MVYEFGEEQARNTLLHTIVIISGADVKLNTIKAIYRKTVSPIDVLLPARELDVSERSLSSRKAKKIVEVQYQRRGLRQSFNMPRTRRIIFYIILALMFY